MCYGWHRLEEGNEKRREEVAALNAAVERETKVWEEACRVFEEELAGLAAKMRAARTSFVGGLIHSGSTTWQLN